MVRNYAQLMELISSKRKQTPLEWNKLINEALSDLTEAIAHDDPSIGNMHDPVTFEEHRRLVRRIAILKGWGDTWHLPCGRLNVQRAMDSHGLMLRIEGSGGSDSVPGSSPWCTREVRQVSLQRWSQYGTDSPDRTSPVALCALFSPCQAGIEH